MSEKIQARTIVAKIREGRRGKPQYFNEEGQNETQMKAEMRADGAVISDYIFSKVEAEKQEENKDELKSIIITLIDKLEDVKKEINSSKLPGQTREELAGTISKVVEEVKKQED